MTGMTPERLAEIEARHRVAEQAYRTGATGTTPMDVGGLTINESLDLVAESAQDVPALLAEVERLKSIETSVEAALRTSREMQAEQRSSVTLAFLQGALDDLLNPTEGEDDERR